MGLSTLTRRLFGVGAASLLATPTRANPLLGVTHGPRSSTTVSGGTPGPGGPSTALLHFNGTNGSTSFPDSSGNNHVFTANGTAALSTAQFKFGTASAYFDGSSTTYIGTTDAALVMGAGNFTIDFWLRLQSQTGQDNFFAFNSTQAIIYSPSPSTALNFYFGSVLITGTISITTGTWYHIALTRQGTSTRLFINGTQSGPIYTDTTNYSYANISIGSQSGGAAMTGWVDEVRILLGTAAWTANFTPPTAPYTQ